MKNRRKRAQREEVRKILATMRLELAAQRLAQEKSAQNKTVLHLNELFTRSQRSLQG
jgi:ABC-type uncharacterized transport system ATPase subunit